MQQLKEKNADVEHFISLVDDYVWYYEQEKAMQEDIKKRGLSYKTISSQGKEYLKDNPSLKKAVMYNKQKLDILKEMQLTTANVIKTDGDDDL